MKQGNDCKKYYRVVYSTEKIIDPKNLDSKNSIIVKDLWKKENYNYDLTINVIVRIYKEYMELLKDSNELEYKKKFIEISEKLMKSFRLLIVGIGDLIIKNDNANELYEILSDSLSLKENLQEFVASYLEYKNNGDDKLLINIVDCYLDDDIVKEIETNLLTNNIIITLNSRNIERL